MTETFRVGGPNRLPDFSCSGAQEAGEAGLIDRLIELVLAFEPIEHKQTSAPVEQAMDPAASDAVPGTQAGTQADAALERETAKPSVDSTRAMLAQMRLVLDREAARLGEDGLEGKPAVDQVALIARTLEKIDQMERLIADDQARAASQSLSPGERDELRQTVRQLILAAAERMTAERLAGQAADSGVQADQHPDKDRPDDLGAA